MQYNQPYGVSDPNAPYINGNPTTGTMGSIPPAASIEYPQRELAALIAAAGLTPDNADLAQVLKAIKLVDVLNVFKQATNGGTAAAWAMTCPTLPVMPPPVGTSVWFKPGVASVNGGTTFSLNGSAPKPVVCVDLLAHPHRRHRRDRLAAVVFRRRELAGGRGIIACARCAAAAVRGHQLVRERCDRRRRRL